MQYRTKATPFQHGCSLCMSAFEKLCVQRHAAYVRYLNNTVREALVRAYIAGQRRNNGGQTRILICMLNKDVLCRILLMCLRTTPFVVYYQRKALTSNAFVRRQNTALVEFTERGKSCIQLVRWLCSVMCACDMPGCYWKTYEEWKVNYERYWPEHKIRQKWVRQVRSHKKKIAAALNSEPKKMMIIDIEHIARDIDGMEKKEDIFENGSEWFIDDVSSAEEDNKKDRLLLFEPQNLTAEDVSRQLTPVLGKANMDHFVIIRPMLHGCQLFFLDSLAHRASIEQNCIFHGFSKSAAMDGRIVPLNRMPKAFRVPY